MFWFFKGFFSQIDKISKSALSRLLTNYPFYLWKYHKVKQMDQRSVLKEKKNHKCNFLFILILHYTFCLSQHCNILQDDHCPTQYLIYTHLLFDFYMKEVIISKTWLHIVQYRYQSDRDKNKDLPDAYITLGSPILVA